MDCTRLSTQQLQKLVENVTRDIKNVQGDLDKAVFFKYPKKTIAEYKSKLEKYTQLLNDAKSEINKRGVDLND